MPTASELITQLGLLPHPEGGWYRETWRDVGSLRGHGTAILYLLQTSQRSHWHRVDAVEIWHAYSGDGFELQLWDGEKPPVTLRLGPDIAAGQVPQHVIPAGVWQSAAPLPGNCGWALAGCTVSPSFEFAGFEMAAPGWHPPGAPKIPLQHQTDNTAPGSASAGAIAESADLPWPPSRHLGRADLTGHWRWLGGLEAAVVGEFSLGQAAQGLPGHIHGGLLAALCDEAMGWVAWMSGYAAPGARVMVDYLAPVRPGDTVSLNAKLLRVEGRQLHLAADLAAQGKLVVRSFGRYVSIRPRDWQPFAGWPGLERFTSGAGLDQS